MKYILMLVVLSGIIILGYNDMNNHSINSADLNDPTPVSQISI